MDEVEILQTALVGTSEPNSQVTCCPMMVTDLTLHVVSGRAPARKPHSGEGYSQ